MSIAGSVSRALNRVGRAVGRRAKEPSRDTIVYPRLVQMGSMRDAQTRPAYKPTPRNMRYFSRTPYARRAINAIKNPIAQLEWEVAALPGVTITLELENQIETATYCLAHPNQDDSFRTLVEQVVEDWCCGAGAIEVQAGGDPLRPVWMWPVDGLSIQIFAGWSGNPDEARYFQANGYSGLGNLAGDGVKLRNDELVYIRPNPNTMEPFGVGPLEVAFQSVARLLGTATNAGNVAQNIRPTAGLWLKNVDDRGLQAFRAYWRNEVEGQGMFPIFGSEDAEVKRLYPEGDKALFLEYQSFVAREIATAFDLSPMNLGVDGDVNRNQGEVNEDRDRNATVKPTATSIAEHLTREVLHRKLGMYQLYFRFRGLDREDEKATSDIYEKYYKNNAVTPNEQRDRLGMTRSPNPWCDLTFADFQIAQAAARGEGGVTGNAPSPDDGDGRTPSPDALDGRVPVRKVGAPRARTSE